jgi:hypothetical protein
MFGLGFFVAGFASGWVARSAVESSHDLAVGVVAAAYGAYDRTRRLVAIEREHLEDILAEGKARYESKRARSHAAKAADARRETDAQGAQAGVTSSGARVADVAADVVNVANVARVRAA